MKVIVMRKGEFSHISYLDIFFLSNFIRKNQTVRTRSGQINIVLATQTGKLLKNGILAIWASIQLYD